MKPSSSSTPLSVGSREVTDVQRSLNLVEYGDGV